MNKKLSISLALMIVAGFCIVGHARPVGERTATPVTEDQGDNWTPFYVVLSSNPAVYMSSAPTPSTHPSLGYTGFKWRHRAWKNNSSYTVRVTSYAATSFTSSYGDIVPSSGTWETYNLSENYYVILQDGASGGALNGHGDF